MSTATPTARPPAAPERPEVAALPALTTTRRSRLREQALKGVLLLTLLATLMALLVIIVDLAVDGAGRISSEFITGFDSRFADQAGLLPALIGTIWLLFLTAALTVPIGIGTALYLNEYARPGRITRLLELNISTLAGVPSVVYGLLGLVVFVRGMEMGRTLIAGALTLSLLLLPLVIVAAREAVRAVPDSLRHASLACGATRWTTVRRVVLPAALPGIMTGLILSLARAIGETAPLLTIGALTYITFVPKQPLDQFTALPIQIYNWLSRPQPEFHDAAAAGILVLLGLLLVMNAAAIIIRAKSDTRW